MNQSSQRKDGRNSSQFVLSYLLAAFLTFHAISYYILDPMRPRPATYSEFLQAVASGSVAEVAIGVDEIEWVEKRDITPEDDGAAPSSSQTDAGASLRYRTDRIPGMDDSSVLERLERTGATFIGRPENHFCPSRCSPPSGSGCIDA